MLELYVYQLYGFSEYDDEMNRDTARLIFRKQKYVEPMLCGYYTCNYTNTELIPYPVSCTMSDNIFFLSNEGTLTKLFAFRRIVLPFFDHSLAKYIASNILREAGFHMSAMSVMEKPIDEKTTPQVNLWTKDKLNKIKTIDKELYLQLLNDHIILIKNSTSADESNQNKSN